MTTEHKDRLSTLAHQWPKGDDELDFTFVEFISGVTMLGQLIDREFQRVVQTRFGMSPGDMRVLFAMRRAGTRLRPIELNRRLLITSGAIAKQLDRLEQRQLVKRLFAGDNIRSFLVELTDEGRKVADEGMAATSGLPIMHASFYSLSKTDRAMMLRAIHRMLQTTEKHIDETPID